MPCFALGVDPNSSKDVMLDKPRKSNEGVFAHGGIFTMVIYSILIAILTLGGFMFPAIQYLHQIGASFSFATLRAAYWQPSVLIHAQTYAFCILSLSELAYAAGMRDAKTSIFKFHWLDNKVMLGAIAFGVVAQLAVTEIPFLYKLFEVSQLHWNEWLIIIAVSLAPLLMHEIIVLVNKIRKRG